METIYRDYSPRGVRFYYVYKQLAHPETNSYVDPVNLNERLAHVQAAKSSLKTEFTWICDNMSNDLKHSMGDRPNSEFVIDPHGKVVIKRSWSDPEQLRKDLVELVGESNTVTTVADLGYRVDPRPKQAASGIVERLELPAGMMALKSTLVSTSEGDQYFVKLRAEADADLLETGNGKLYVAFHIDPIYGVHWNNDSMQVEYEMKLPNGVNSDQLTGTGPKVDVSADVDPREFLIDINSDSKITEPLEITAKFMICDDAETFCIPVTEVFTVQLKEDPELGRRMSGMRARGGRGNRDGRRGRGNNRGNRAERMMRRDTNKDGKISKEEAPEPMQERFDDFDTNDDGFLDKDELEAMDGRGRGKRRSDR